MRERRAELGPYSVAPQGSAVAAASEAVGKYYEVAVAAAAHVGPPNSPQKQIVVGAHLGIGDTESTLVLVLGPLLRHFEVSRFEGAIHVSFLGAAAAPELVSEVSSGLEVTAGPSEAACGFRLSSLCGWTQNLIYCLSVVLDSAPGSAEPSGIRGPSGAPGRIAEACSGPESLAEVVQALVVPAAVQEAARTLHSTQQAVLALVQQP